MKKKRYNHAFTIAFTVDSDHDGYGDDKVTAQELREGLAKRLEDIGNAELIQACGSPFDSFETKENA